jgi:hypothetical protein
VRVALTVDEGEPADADVEARLDAEREQSALGLRLRLGGCASRPPFGLNGLVLKRRRG